MGIFSSCQVLSFKVLQVIKLEVRMRRETRGYRNGGTVNGAKQDETPREKVMLDVERGKVDAVT